jgi:hypothetical protein
MRTPIIFMLSCLLISGCSPQSTETKLVNKPSPIATVKVVVEGTVQDVPIAIKQDFATPSENIPTGWMQQTIPTEAKRMVWTKELYTVIVTREAGHSAVCQFPDQPKVDAPFITQLQNAVYFTSKNNTKFARGKGSSDNKTTVYTVCQNGDQVFASPTTFGFINYYVPVNTDETILKEMDAIISKL